MNKKPLDILIVSPVYRPFYELGGPAISVPALKKGLERLGHNVNVVTPLHSNKQVLDNDVLYQNFYKIDFFLNYFNRFKTPIIGVIIASLKLLRNTDVVILNCGFYPANLVIGIISIIFRKKCIFIPRGAGSKNRMRHNFFIKRVYLILENLLLKYSSLVQLSKSEDVSIYKKKEIKVIPNYLPLDIPLEDKAKTDKKIKIIFCGRATIEKGVDKFVTLAKKFPSIEFTLITPKIFFIDGNLDNIHILVNPEQEIIRKAYREAHFNFLWSYGEGLSMSLFEGASMGCLPLCNSSIIDEAIFNQAFHFDDFSRLVMYLNSINKIGSLETILSSCEALKFHIAENFCHSKIDQLWQRYLDDD